ncbi:MAG: DUF6785 family protein [Armatimonadota bacterium]|nr:DUF6785 family protein [Armatimonadota bacterium]
MTVRAILIAIVLSVVSVAWIHQASLVQTPGQTIYAPVYLVSVPPVPALMFLVALVGLRPLLARRGVTRPITRREMLAIYAFLVIAIPPVTFGIIELMLPWITVPVYFDSPSSPTAKLAAQMPGWYAPDSTEVIRTMYEGTETEAVPWREWLRPLAYWTVFLTILYATGLCLVSLFRKQWSEYERLRYPLLLIPLDITAESATTETREAVEDFFRNPLVWVAVGLVTLHHALNVANAYNPAVTAFRDRYGLAPFFTEEPWTPFRSLTFFHRPEIIGFGWFVSLDVLFSVWFFRVLGPLSQSLATIFGYRAAAGWPYVQEQGTGAFVMLLLVLVWTGRRHLGEMLRAAIGRDRASHEDEPMPPAWAVFGMVGGFVALVGWTMTTGMSMLPAAAYMAILLAFGLVYSRIRAETGVPTMWAYPFVQARNTMVNVMGGDAITGPHIGNLLGISGFAWLGRGYFMSLMGYQLENVKLAEETGLDRRGMIWLIMAAFIVGMLAGYVFNLRSYYQFGANVLHGGTTGGGYNVQTAVTEWSNAASQVKNPSLPDWSRVQGSIGGAILTLLLVVTRFQFLRSPFHPIGYALSLNYGYCLWGPFLAVWVVKAIVHRLGGARWFRRAIPFFLGLAFGDLFIGGLSWLAMWIFGPEIFNGYMVQFG